MFRQRDLAQPETVNRVVLVLGIWLLAAAVTFTILSRPGRAEFVEGYLSRLHRESSSQPAEHEAYAMPRSHLDRG